MNRDAVERAVRVQLAADYACEPEQLLQPTHTLVSSVERPGRRRFPWRDKRVALVTTGSAVVLCCDAPRVDWARRNLLEVERDDLFSPESLARIEEFVKPDGQYLVGPVLRFACAADGLAALAPAPGGLEYEIYVEDRIPELHRHRGFDYALGYGNTERPDRVACVARDGETIAGVAGASADSDTLYQIGVQVEPRYRNRGAASRMVWEVASRLLARGVVPYYSTYTTNLASIRTALRIGFFLSWVDVETRDR